MTKNKDQIYSLEGVPVFEAMYGESLMSLGGFEAVDSMFDQMQLADKKILDIGSGIGGMAYHLCEKHSARVIGLEIYPWMVEYATMRTPAAIKDMVDFICYDEDGGIPLPSQSLDIVCSKGVLTNVKDKRVLFKEVHRLLNDSGELCLVDWMSPEKNGPRYEELSLGDSIYLETESSYKDILEESGFRDITFEDRSAEYLSYIKALVVKLDSGEHRKHFSGIIGAQLRDELIKSTQKHQREIEEGQQLSFRIHANV